MKRLLLIWGCTGALAGAQPRLELEATSVFGNALREERPNSVVVNFKPHQVTTTGPGWLKFASDSYRVFDVQVPFLWGVSQQLRLPLPEICYNLQPEVVKPPFSIKARFDYSSADDEDRICLLVSPRKNHFAYLGGYKSLLSNDGEFRCNQPQRLADLPACWWTYLGQDFVVVHDLPNLKLGPEVERAWLDWTAAGGSLILVSNADPHELKGSLLEGRDPSAQVLLSHQGRPLLLRRSYGGGRLWWIRQPVTGDELLGRKLCQKLWGLIVADQRGREWREWSFREKTGLQQLPELPSPATSALALYLAVYVLLVIPAIYGYLRRSDRLIYLIVVVPLCSLLMTLGAYHFNSRGRGKQFVQREEGIAWIRSGQTSALVDHLGVFFVPQASRLSLKWKPNRLLRPASARSSGSPNPILRHQGEQLEMEPLRLSQWGVSRWSALGLEPLAGPIELSSTPVKDRWRVKVRNASGLRLSQCVLMTDADHCTPTFALSSGSNQLESGPASESLGDWLKDWQSDHRARLSRLLGDRPLLLALTQDFKLLEPLDLSPKVVTQTLVVISEDRP